VSNKPRVGLVLGGGGARGAYEAGVLQGLYEVLSKAGMPLALDILCGSSIGALNAAWLGAHAHEPDFGIPGLAAEWRGLKLEDTVRLHRHLFMAYKSETRIGPRSLLDPVALEAIMRERVPWTQLHYNLASSKIQALIVTALNIATGQTTTFAQLGPSAYYRPTRDPRRNAKLVWMNADHVLASSAFPWLLPAREIEGDYFCDGGLRYNTPISPALRAGADRLVVVSLLAATGPVPPHGAVARQRIRAFPSPVFLLGKLLGALLLDPIQYDLLVLERFNVLMTALEKELAADELARVQEVMTNTRGVSYRRVPTLVFQPSRDLGVMAGEFLEHRARATRARTLLRTISHLGRTWEADLMSFIVLDGGFADMLIELGRTDVHARAQEVTAFFAGTEGQRDR
jgi:NTE family protein